MQLTTLVSTPIIINTFTNETHIIRLSNDIDQDKMTALEARIRAIEGVDLYDLVKATKMCLVPNVVVPKIYKFSNSLNILEHNALLPISNHTVTK